MIGFWYLAKWSTTRIVLREMSGENLERHMYDYMEISADNNRAE